MTKAEFEAAKKRVGSQSPWNEWRDMAYMLERAMGAIEHIANHSYRTLATDKLLAEWNAETGGEEEGK